MEAVAPGFEAAVSPDDDKLNPPNAEALAAGFESPPREVVADGVESPKENPPAVEPGTCELERPRLGTLAAVGVTGKVD